MYNIEEENITDFIVVSKSGVEEEFLDCRFEIEFSEGVPPVLTVYNQYDDIIAFFKDFEYLRMT